jgi:hypothetical protein
MDGLGSLVGVVTSSGNVMSAAGVGSSEGREQKLGSLVADQTGTKAEMSK